MNKIQTALKAALPHTLPILTGYLFISIAYGIYMNAAGLPGWYAIVTSICIYGGSLEYLVVWFLKSSWSPVTVLLTALMVQARHLFYGISMLKKYNGTGKKKWYLIYAMSDETFAVNYSAVIPDNVDRGWFYFWVTFLDQMYWVIGCAIGGLAGSLLTLNTKGIDFVMNAMFLVIALNSIEKVPARIPALLGLGCSLLALALFGPNRFLIPAMILILIALMIYRPFEQRSQQ
ncbi:MAG: AzlC family ABC transporter permease [Galactobacillus timonensis]|uniref:AzlC family ABC transporter permease n=1 Tax=Galactobacillus timonensis TaxID=2041840 RepID=UPI00240A4C87|nr:AzlC family ABC transporter permease [Galactobacillus timonensis]MDD6600676.1 AzlC family ABC transporter permease [Galactobacillus timonensis]